MHKDQNRRSVGISVLSDGQIYRWMHVKKTVIMESKLRYSWMYVVRRLQTGLDVQLYTKYSLVCDRVALAQHLVPVKINILA